MLIRIPHHVDEDPNPAFTSIRIRIRLLNLMQIRLFTLIRIRLEENDANPDPQRLVQGDVTVPDYFDEFSNCDMVWDEKLGLVQDWQLFLTRVPLDDARDLNNIRP